MAMIRAGGGVTIAECESSCVVYGMPRAAVQRGGAGWVMGVGEIAGVMAGVSR
jgi:two-component system chemotaxis response regulator CheB